MIPHRTSHQRQDPIFAAIKAAEEARRAFEEALKELSAVEGEWYKMRHLYPRSIAVKHNGIKKHLRTHDELRKHYHIIHPRRSKGVPFTENDVLAWELAREEAHRQLDAVLTSYEAMRKRYNLDALETAEATASAASLKADLNVLSIRPSTLAGSAALLRFMMEYLEEDNSVDPVIDALGNVETTLMEIADAY